MGDWTEKYRPKTLDDIVGNDKAINEFRRWALSWKNNKTAKKAVILAGKPGIGKTSSAQALANDFNWTTIELNTSDARNANKIKKVATTGSVNETFSDNGNFITSKQGGRKLIILDEADNLYETSANSGSSENDLSDRGGKKAIVDTIRNTNQPIVLIVNDYYNLIKGSGESLKSLCKIIRFYDPFPNQIYNFLKRISIDEKINIDLSVLKNIADRSKGDIRSAINDLQSICADKAQIDVKSLSVLGYRDREKDIFSALREIFKTKNIQTLRETVKHIDVDPNLLILWINENLPKEYIDNIDLINGYSALSKADVFLGRTRRKQNYGLWSYACDIMNGGIAVSKSHSYPNNSYNFPTWLRGKKAFKNKSNLERIVINKISKSSHLSNSKAKNDVLNYFISIFRNNTGFAIQMKNQYDLTEPEIEFLLGKTHAYKLKEIIAASEIEKAQVVKEEKSDNKKIEDEDKEKIQQSLFDF